MKSEAFKQHNYRRMSLEATRLMAAAIIVLVLSGCAVGPDYVQVDPPGA
jgi:hypothetical protein